MQRKATPADWYAIGLQAWGLWAEAGMVIWLRSMRIAAGGAAAEREAALMVTEKMAAGMDLAFKMATAAAPTPEGAARRTMRHYGKLVSANRRRLSR